VAPIDPIKGNNMGRIGKEKKPVKEGDDKSKKKPPSRAEDDDYEDGDIATPKRDRDGDDDEPL
jgi:hypothetical protein